MLLLLAPSALCVIVLTRASSSRCMSFSLFWEQMAHHPNVRHMSRSLSNGSVETPFRPSSGRQGQGGEEVVTVFGTELEMLAEGDEDDDDDADSVDDDGDDGEEDGDYASSDPDVEVDGELRRMPISARSWTTSSGRRPSCAPRSASCALLPTRGWLPSRSGKGGDGAG